MMKYCGLLLVVFTESVISDSGKNESSLASVSHMSFNDSLKLFNEAVKDIEDVTQSIANIEEDIEKSIELQNEVIKTKYLNNKLVLGPRQLPLMAFKQ